MMNRTDRYVRETSRLDRYEEITIVRNKDFIFYDS